MADVSPQAVAAARARLGVGPERFPRHVAIIMDGNGRWASRRGLPRHVGHQEGAKVVRRIVTEAASLGLEALTLYSFSIENWSRPPDEIAALMHLYAEYLVQERPTLISHNVRLRHLGRRQGLPASVLDELDRSLDATASCSGMVLSLALNYGSRAEITDAVASICREVEAGRLSAGQVDEVLISEHLGTAGLPDVDLVIRTSGELRLSNFLLWQVSYAEFYACQALWPDFDEVQFREGIVAYASRQRRFGGTGGSSR